MRFAFMLAALLFAGTASAQDNAPPPPPPESVTRAELEGLTTQQAADRVFSAVAARTVARSAVGTGSGEKNSALSLQSFTLAPYFRNGLCSFDRVAVWLVPPQGSPTVRDKDDPGVVARSVTVDHYYADPGEWIAGNTSLNMIPCPLDVTDKRFFRADNRDVAVVVKYAMKGLRQSIQLSGKKPEVECDVPDHYKTDPCADTAALILGFDYSRATLSDDLKTLTLHDRLSQDRLVLTLVGMSAQHIRYIIPEPVIVTN